MDDIGRTGSNTMLAFINGKEYDIFKAKLCGDWKYGVIGRDLSSFYEGLYKKDNGEIFLYGVGEPFTDYAEYRENGIADGEINKIPFTFKEAKRWVRKRLDANEYIALFGVPEENDENVKIIIDIPREMTERAKQQSSEKGVSLSDYIASLI